MSNWEIIQKRMSGELPPPGPPFDATPTTAILVFEGLVLLGFLAAVFILPRFRPRLWRHAAVMAGAVLIFEIFTGPMWRNLHMGKWAYLYQQTSWVLTLGWTALFLATDVFVDHLARARSALSRFAIKLAALTPVVLGFEILLGAIGLRSYAPEVWASVCGIKLAGVPVEVLYYVPVFAALILGFHGYWALVLDGAAVAPRPRPRWARGFLLALLGVVLFELMIEPMVTNAGLPKWAYYYHDLNLLLTLLWVVVLGLAVITVEHFLIHWDLGHRFLAALAVLALVATPIEAAFIAKGIRIYGPSTCERFSGLTIPPSGVPMEVVFAIPLYFALVLGFTRYLDLAASNPRQATAKP